MCAKVFVTKNDLKAHIENVHVESELRDKNFIFNICCLLLEILNTYFFLVLWFLLTLKGLLAGYPRKHTQVQRAAKLYFFTDFSKNGPNLSSSFDV